MKTIKEIYIDSFVEELEKNAFSLGSAKGIARKAWNLFGDTKPMIGAAEERLRTGVAKAGAGEAARISKYQGGLDRALSRQSSQLSALNKAKSIESGFQRKGLLERTPLKIGKRRRVERLQQARANRKAADAAFSGSTRAVSNVQDKITPLRVLQASKEAPVRSAFNKEMSGIGMRRAGNMAVRTGIVATPLAGAAAIGNSMYNKRSSNSMQRSYY